MMPLKRIREEYDIKHYSGSWKDHRAYQEFLRGFRAAERLCKNSTPLEVGDDHYDNPRFYNI
jgi:hypothetical protein